MGRLFHYTDPIMLTTARVAAVAADLDYVLVSRVAAMIAAVFTIACNGASATVVCTSVVVCHFAKVPQARLNFVALDNTHNYNLIIAKQTIFLVVLPENTPD